VGEAGVAGLGHDGFDLGMPQGCCCVAAVLLLGFDDDALKKALAAKEIVELTRNG
jgi:hypothetical protein